jgi:hypothetical protein
MYPPLRQLDDFPTLMELTRRPATAAAAPERPARRRPRLATLAVHVRVRRVPRPAPAAAS